MKIRLPFTIEIPAEGIEAWAVEYGKDKDEVREDIINHLFHGLQGTFEAELTGWKMIRTDERR